MSGAQPESFIPTAGRLDRALRSLQEYYPARTVHDCRHALARMYGHADWDELQSAMQAAGSASPVDDDVPREVVGARFQLQYDAILASLAGVTDQAMLAAQDLDQELLGAGCESISRRYDPVFNEKRLRRARYAWTLLYARHVILQVRATAGQEAHIPENRDDIDFSFRVDLLPRALESWLAHHRPLLRHWGERIGRIEVQQHAATDLLRFSYSWGEACLECSVEIPKPLQIYPVALSARWFGWVACSRMPRLQGAFAALRSDASAADERGRASTLISEAISEEEARFILAQPREDFRSHSASAREQHIHAGYALVRRWVSESATRNTVREIMTREVWSPLSPAMPGG